MIDKTGGIVPAFEFYDFVSNADGYEIYRSTKENSGYSLIASETLSFYHDKTGIVSGNTYYYKVRAYLVTSSGEKIYSDFVTGSVRAAYELSYEAVRAYYTRGKRSYTYSITYKNTGKGYMHFVDSGSYAMNFNRISYHIVKGGNVYTEKSEVVTDHTIGPGETATITYVCTEDWYHVGTDAGAPSYAVTIIYDDCSYIRFLS